MTNVFIDQERPKNIAPCASNGHNPYAESGGAIGGVGHEHQGFGNTIFHITNDFAAVHWFEKGKSMRSLFG